MNNDSYVYILFDLFGVPRYVGKGRGNRWLDHEKKSDLRNWMKNEFIEQAWIILEDVPKVKVREKMSEEDAYQLEMTLISAIGRHPNGPLVNMTDGGDGTRGHSISQEGRRRLSLAAKGRSPSEKVRKRLSELNKGRRMPPEHGIKLSAAKKGKPLSAAHRAALSEGQKRRWRVISPEQKAKLIANLDWTGKTCDPAVVEQRCAKRRGRKMIKTDAMRRASDARRGQKLSVEHRAKMRASHLRLWEAASAEKFAETVAKTLAGKAKSIGVKRPCPECGREFKVLGLGLHRTIKHGYVEMDTAKKNPAIRQLIL